MKSIIIKLFTGTITDEELIKLHDWLENPKNQSALEEYVRNYHDLNISVLKNDVNHAYKKVMQTIANKSKTKKSIPFYNNRLFKYAAAILIFAFVGYLLLPENNVENSNKSTIVNNNIKIGTNKATLTLQDGTDVTLENGKRFVSTNLMSNGKELIYEEVPVAKTEVVYNYLTIPRGGQYFVKLTDGTQVWLNSESKLKYPVNFVEGKTREVELIYGEAYFDVSPSTDHNGDKFKVLTGIQQIEVIGTEFNIKAYQDEDMIYTTLVEGKIDVDNSINSQTLNPNEQAILNKENKDVTISEIEVYSEIAWKKGMFSFKDKSLKSIMKVLSRWYDVDVVFEDKALEEVRFKGVLSKNQNIEEILILIKKTKFIQAYEIDGNIIKLKN